MLQTVRGIGYVIRRHHDYPRGASRPVCGPHIRIVARDGAIGVSRICTRISAPARRPNIMGSRMRKTCRRCCESSSGGCAPALIALAGGWWLMRRALTPVAQLTLAAEKIHDRNLSEKRRAP